MVCTAVPNQRKNLPHLYPTLEHLSFIIFGKGQGVDLKLLCESDGSFAITGDQKNILAVFILDLTHALISLAAPTFLVNMSF
jgi:hypothetical protein